MVATEQSRLSTKGQIVIPKEVRDRLGWRPGDDILVEETQDSVILRLHRRDRIDPEIARASITAMLERFAKLNGEQPQGPAVPLGEMSRMARDAVAQSWERSVRNEQGRGQSRRRKRR